VCVCEITQKADYPVLYFALGSGSRQDTALCSCLCARPR